MNRIVKYAKFGRTHWKKSTLAVVLSAFGCKYVMHRIQVLQMMREYCEEARSYGEQTAMLGSDGVASTRRVTVVLNPTAKNGKSMGLFEKYAAPLLHLAGIRVSIIKTEHEGQAKDLLEIMDNTDAVIVAGGDGTLLEAVTGLCRRDDSDVAVQRFPIGIVPVGATNTVAKRLFWGSHLEEAKLLAESAMAIVRWNTRPLNVMEIRGESGKPVFALFSLEWGIFRDVDCNTSKYWYFGFLKSKMAYIFAAFKKIGQPVEAEVSYSPPCDGCSKCWQRVDFKNFSKEQTNRRWWHAFIPRQPTRALAQPGIDYSRIINEECGHWLSLDVSATELIVETDNIFPNCKRDKDDAQSLRVKIGPSWLGRFQYVLEGWKRNKDLSRDDDAWSKIIDVKEIKITPKSKEDCEGWYSIDHEDHEVKSLHITLQPRKINVFCRHK